MRKAPTPPAANAVKPKPSPAPPSGKIVNFQHENAEMIEEIKKVIQLGRDFGFEEKSVFSVSQVITHAKYLQQERARLLFQNTDQKIQFDRQKAELAAKDEAICGMREALERITNPRRSYRLCREIAAEALSIISPCPHKEEVEGLKKELYEFQKEAVALAARNLELSGQLSAFQADLDAKLKASQEIQEAGKRILLGEVEKNTALQVQLCGIREALVTAWRPQYEQFIQEKQDEADKFKGSGDMYGWNFHTGMRSGAIWVDIYLRAILKDLSIPVCSHKEGRVKAEESYEKYRDEALKWHRVAGEREEQLAALQAALAEERGKVMEAEFYQEHLKPGIPDPIGCATCILSKGWDKRHFWKREQWTEEVKLRTQIDGR